MAGDALENYPDTPLKQAMLRRKLSISHLAKLLAGSDDLGQIDIQRTAVKRWLDPEKGISLASAQKLELLVGLPAETIQRQGRRRGRQADRLAALEATVNGHDGDLDRLTVLTDNLLERVERLEAAASDTRRRQA